MTHRESGSGETGVRKRRNTAGRRQRLPEAAKRGAEAANPGRKGGRGYRRRRNRDGRRGKRAGVGRRVGVEPAGGAQAGGWEGGAMRG